MRKSQIDEFAAIDRDRRRRPAVERREDSATKSRIGLLKFSLEAREGLRESMEGRFDEMGQKHDQEIDLLKDVLRHVTGSSRARAQRHQSRANVTSASRHVNTDCAFTHSSML